MSSYNAIESSLFRSSILIPRHPRPQRRQRLDERLGALEIPRRPHPPRLQKRMPQHVVHSVAAPVRLLPTSAGVSVRSLAVEVDVVRSEEDEGDAVLNGAAVEKFGEVGIHVAIVNLTEGKPETIVACESLEMRVESWERGG